LVNATPINQLVGYLTHTADTLQLHLDDEYPDIIEALENIGYGQCENCGGFTPSRFYNDTFRLCDECISLEANNPTGVLAGWVRR
jgi:hypothetical protein